MVTKKSIEKISENEEITTAKICRKATLKFKNSFHEFSNPQKIYYLLFFSFTRGNRFDKRNRFMFYPEFQKEIPIFVGEKESIWKK